MDSLSPASKLFSRLASSAAHSWLVTGLGPTPAAALYLKCIRSRTGRQPTKFQLALGLRAQTLLPFCTGAAATLRCCCFIRVWELIFKLDLLVDQQSEAAIQGAPLE